MENNTLKRIEKALDLRFEKDTTLYVSKEDAEKIKKSLYLNEWQNISAFNKKLGSKILAKLIIKNNYLISFKEVLRDSSRMNILKEIFLSITGEYLLKISEDILEDLIFSTIGFKNFIISLALEEMSIKKCHEFYKDETKSIKNRSKCFRRILIEGYINEGNSYHIYRFISGEILENKELSSYLNSQAKSFLGDIFGVLDSFEKQNLANYIINEKLNMGDTEPNFIFWSRAIINLRMEGFTKLLEYLIDNSIGDIRVKRKIVTKMLPKFKTQIEDLEYKEGINFVYKNGMDLRISLIRMLKKPEIKENIDDFLELFEETGMNIREMEEKERILDEIDSKGEKKTIEKVLNEIADSASRLDSKGTLCYHSISIKDYEFELYKKHLEKIGVKEVLSYSFAKILKQPQIPEWYKEIILDDNTDMKNRIASRIGQFHDDFYDKNPRVIGFLQEYKYYKILEKFDKRG